MEQPVKKIDLYQLPPSIKVRPTLLFPHLDSSPLQNQRVSFSSASPFIPTYVTSQLTQSSDPAGMYTSRVQNRQVLLENPVRESKAKKERDEKKERRRKDAERKKKRAGGMGKRERRERGVWAFDETVAKCVCPFFGFCSVLNRDGSRFDLFVPLHHLWMGYMSELLNLPREPVSSPPSGRAIPGSASMHPKLVKADFHGSIMTGTSSYHHSLSMLTDPTLQVRQSKNPCLVGLSGIVIHETENAFKVVTQRNKVKRPSSIPFLTLSSPSNHPIPLVVLPKQNTIFTFSTPLYSTLPVSHNPSLPFPLPPALVPTEGTASSSNPMPKLGTAHDKPYLEFELHGNQFRFRAAERAGRKFKHKETIEL